MLSTFSGAAILGVIGALTARLGAVLRCTTALIARITFGSKGASCIAFVLTMGMTGWWGVQTEMFANAVLHLAQQVFHVSPVSYTHLDVYKRQDQYLVWGARPFLG